MRILHLAVGAVHVLHTPRGTHISNKVVLTLVWTMYAAECTHATLPRQNLNVACISMFKTCCAPQDEKGDTFWSHRLRVSFPYVRKSSHPSSSIMSSIPRSKPIMRNVAFFAYTINGPSCIITFNLEESLSYETKHSSSKNILSPLDVCQPNCP